MNLNSELPDNYKTQDDLQFEFEEYLRIYGYVPYNDKQYRFVGYVYIQNLLMEQIGLLKDLQH